MAFQHLWKEDMRLLSIRKYQAKSQKKLELCLCSPYNGYQKHRSSIHSCFSSPGIPPLKDPYSCISTICTWDTCNTDIQRGKNQYQNKKPIWIYHFFHKCSYCSCSGFSYIWKMRNWDLYWNMYH